MEKIEVEVIKAENYYKIVRKSDQRHIKSIKTQYVVDLIKEHGVIFRSHPLTFFSPEELCALAENHYKILAKTKLCSAGQYIMADKLNYSGVTHKKIIVDDKEEQTYSVMFSSGLDVYVNQYHFRMFASLPFYKTHAKPVQNTLQL